VTTLRRIQKEQAEWSLRNFGERPSYQPLLGIAEEVGELCHAHLKNEQGVRMTEDHEANKRDAVGDIMIYLMDYCSKEGFDVTQCLVETWNKVRQRDWVANPDGPIGQTSQGEKRTELSEAE